MNIDAQNIMRPVALHKHRKFPPTIMNLLIIQGHFIQL